MLLKAEPFPLSRVTGKEKTGGLDEVEIRAVIEANETLTELNKRREFVVQEIHSQGNLTDELKKRIETCYDLGEIEEIYRPFKKKKKTKATLAREAGLEPLADWLWKIGHGEQKPDVTMEIKAKDFLMWLQAMRPMIWRSRALKILLSISFRMIRVCASEFVPISFFEKGRIVSKKAKGYKPHSKFEMYAEFSELAKSLMDKKASHRYLAMRRGWTEEELTVSVEGDEAENLLLFEKMNRYVGCCKGRGWRCRNCKVS